MEILRVLSALLDYPSAELLTHREAVKNIVEQSSISAPVRQRLVDYVEQHLSRDLLELQAEYDGLFERGRSLGLWLFEHVHGESRDRGQAMVDLLGQYRQAGLEISQKELPDYIPLFLEFLSTQGTENAAAWLQDVEHILALLQCRLENRKSEYSLIFEALLDLAGSDLAIEEVRERVAGEKRDDSKQAIDKEWQEEEVTFGAESLDSSCESGRRRPSESQRKDLDVPGSLGGLR